MAIRIERDLTETYIQSAMERAAMNRKAGRVAVRNADGSYAVPSAHSDTTYTVKVINLTQLQASCTCPNGAASDARGICWHKIQALSEETRRLGGRYVVKPRKTAPTAGWIKTGFAR